MATGDDKPPSLDADIDMTDLASLDAPASSSSVDPPSTRFRPRAKGKAKPKAEPKPKLEPEPEPKPKLEPEPEPKPKLEPEPQPEATSPASVAAPPEDGVDAMDVDGAGADGVGDEDEDFVVREIDVYFTPKPFDEDTMLLNWYNPLEKLLAYSSLYSHVGIDSNSVALHKSSLKPLHYAIDSFFLLDELDYAELSLLLYIMQYPLRPCWRPYELNEICKEVRVKPWSSKVEVDLDINTESDNYDPEVSSSFSLTKQTLSSSKAADVADYAVGVLRGNLVHLNHIDAVMQLRPSMSHLYSGRSHIRQSLQQGATNGGTGSPMVPSVKVKGHSENSKEYTEESEPWISLTYEPAGSNIASKYHAEMISNEGGPIDFTMSTSDYVMSLCPGGSANSKDINRCHAIREMLLLPLEERLRKWFTEVSQVNRFDALMHLAPTYSEEDILKVLPVCADLVRGLWVGKSTLLFDDGYALQRDKVLLKFTKNDSIPLKDLDTVIRTDDLRRRKILNPLCKRREKLKDYKFKVAADLSFIKRYPHIVKEQDYAWSLRETTMHDPHETCSNPEQRKTKNSTRSNIPSKGPDPNTSKVRDGSFQGSEVHSVLGTIFTANKVRSIQAVVRDLRQLAAKYASNRKDGPKLQALSNAAKTCASLPHKELHASICLVAVPVHDVYVQKPELRNSLRNVLIKLFRDRDSNGTLTKQEILECAVGLLKREITEKEYHQAVAEICVPTEDGQLVLKNGDKS